MRLSVRWAPGMAALLLVASACGSSATPARETEEQREPPRVTSTPHHEGGGDRAGAGGSGEHGSGEHGSGGGAAHDPGRHADHGSGENERRPVDPEGSHELRSDGLHRSHGLSGSAEASGGGASGAGVSSAGQTGGRPYPAAGDYVYSQSGYEELCSGGLGCNRDKLPRTQLIQTYYRAQSDRAATVVTEVRASHGRFVRTTTRWTRAQALVTRVLLRFSYRKLQFSNDYEPQPPVPSLVFPMEVGKQWGGSWKAGTSGDYAADAVGRTNITVGGRSVDAFEIDTVSHFRGDLNGRANITLYLDPATRAIVRTVGDMKISNALGTYNSKFTTQLVRAPGY